MKYKEQIPKNNLRAIRKTLGISQNNVKDILELYSTDCISHCELGRSVPSIINLFRLSRIYGIPPEKLYENLVENIDQEISDKQK